MAVLAEKCPVHAVSDFLYLSRPVLSSGRCGSLSVHTMCSTVYQHNIVIAAIMIIVVRESCTFRFVSDLFPMMSSLSERER